MDWTRRAVVGALAATILPLETSAEAADSENGFAILEAGPGALRLMPTPATETAVWAYNGQVPGPLIRVRKGQDVKVRLVNKLGQPTSLTWHGVRIANAMDGVAGLTQEPVRPGGSFDYRFKPPDAGFYWYHPHVFPWSAEQIARGLYGVLLVEDPDAPPVDQDLLVVIDDWTLDKAAQMVVGAPGKPPQPNSDDVRRIVTVNSNPVPGAQIVTRPGARVRLRFLNACGSRIVFVAAAGLEPLIIAIDGQASEVFPPAGGTLPIGPGARFECIVDMPNAAGKTPTLTLRDETGAAVPLMSFATKGEPIAARARVARLPQNPRLPSRIPLERSIKVSLVLGDAAEAPAARPAHRPDKPPAPGAETANWLWTIEGRGSDGFSGKPLFRVKRGGAVTLAFVNKTGVAQQMHIHGHVFRILHDLDDGWDPYWRESILIAPGKTKHIAFIADNPGKWALESLMLDRQVTALAGWFEVT